VQELIDSEITLTHWTGPEGTRLEETSLSVGGDEVCASTGTGDLEPYSREYEGYMGNWGNTLDRWYHRAAVAVWPRDKAFANRAETSPAWALDELAAMASAGDVPGARAAAATLAPFWDSAVHARTPEERGRISGLLGKALLAADAVTDAGTAAMLLRPLRIENLTSANVDSLGKIVGSYGQQWTADLLRTWFGGDQPAWAYVGGLERPQWVADWLPGLCAGSCPRTPPSATLVSAPWPPAARHGSAPGSPVRGARPATGRSNCSQAAARATCATPSACSLKTGACALSSGRSRKSAGSTSTPGLTPQNCPSAT
jgi:hypothetical protein